MRLGTETTEKRCATTSMARVSQKRSRLSRLATHSTLAAFPSGHAFHARGFPVRPRIPRLRLSRPATAFQTTHSTRIWLPNQDRATAPRCPCVDAQTADLSSPGSRLVCFRPRSRPGRTADLGSPGDSCRRITTRRVVELVDSMGSSRVLPPPSLAFNRQRRVGSRRRRTAVHARRRRRRSGRGTRVLG